MSEPYNVSALNIIDTSHPKCQNPKCNRYIPSDTNRQKFCCNKCAGQVRKSREKLKR